MLSTYIDVFKKLNYHHHLLILGDGDDWNYYNKLTKNISNISLKKSVPQTKLVSYISAADIGLVLIDPTSLSYYYALPNKIFEYAKAKLLIFAGPGKELIRFSKSHPATFILKSFDVESLYSFFCSWDYDKVQMKKELLLEYSPPDWKNEELKLSSILINLQH